MFRSVVVILINVTRHVEMTDKLIKKKRDDRQVVVSILAISVWLRPLFQYGGLTWIDEIIFQSLSLY